MFNKMKSDKAQRIYYITNVDVKGIDKRFKFSVILLCYILNGHDASTYLHYFVTNV